MAESSLREMWRQKRVQRLIDRLQRKQKGHTKPFSNKILGVNLNMNMNATASFLHSSQSSIPKPAITLQKTRKLPRCMNEPKIVPRETKLSMQRKSMLNPQYKLKKLFENEAATFSGINFQSNGHVVPERGKINLNKVVCPKIVLHSCTSLLDINKEERSAGLSAFSPLVKGLDSWLKKRGKRFTCFKNLQNMATKEPTSLLVRKSIEQENSEPIFGPSSDSRISEVSEDDIDTMEINKQENSSDIKRMLLEGGLDDLCTIIRMGYPMKECEVWLAAMHSTYPDLTNYPLYWECKASINSRLGINHELSAAENPKVNLQVRDLIKKIKFLNLNIPENEAPEEASNKKSRILSEINVNNLVNSNPIQFSVKKKEKNSEDNFLVTPVRRSARKKSCKIHCKNSGVKYVPSLLELSQDIRDKMDFEPNLALLNN